MQINPKLIKNQFEKSMDKYDKNAFAQEILAEKLVEHLIKIKKEYNYVLELGAGTGLLTKQCTKHLLFNKYYANDLIDKSKQYITKIIPDCTFIGGNAQKIKPNKNMDLIISNAMFQWFKNLETVSESFKNILNKDGILAFTTFSTKNFYEIKSLTGLSLEYKNINEIQKELSKNFEIIYSEEFTHILKFNNPLELLAHMKNTGVNSLSQEHWTFKDVKEFCDRYKTKYPDITLTYAPIIIIARKI